MPAAERYAFLLTHTPKYLCKNQSGQPFTKTASRHLPYTTLSYILTVEYYFYFFFCWERNGYLILTTRFRGLPPNKNQASPDYALDNRQ